jgi:D-alanyl-D-alanine carboxypeptidase
MESLKTYLDKIAKKVPTLQVHLESKNKNILYRYSSHEENQRFHSASVGKVFCATLIMMAIEEQKINLDTNISTLIEAQWLTDLFVYKGVDYQNEVTIEHLLSHTSGVNDYFEGKTKNHPSFISDVMSDKTHLYTPYELLDFTKKHQTAVSAPGKRFLYSDTGYVLLGLILEKLYDQSYAKVLRDQIIDPLDLKDTALCFYDTRFDKNTLAPIIFKGIDMHLENSLSCDFAGGGLQTTTQDLAAFLKGLFSEKLINKASLKRMMNMKHSFHGIMRYGLGMIEVSFQRLVPWMRKYPLLYGGLGSLSVHAFYDPKHDDVYIINLGDASKMRLSFMVLVYMAKWLHKK